MKKKSSTIENRVYLFRELAGSFLAQQGQALLSESAERRRGLRALSDLAYVACVLADSEALNPGQVAELMLSHVPEQESPAAKPRARSRKRPKPQASPGVQEKSRTRKKAGSRR